MKQVLSVKEKTAFRTMGSMKSTYRRGFSRGLALGLILLAVFIVLTGNFLYGEGSDDALFIDEKGTVKVQKLEVKGDTNLGDALTINGATTLKDNLTVNGNVGIGTNDPKAKLVVKGATKLADTLTVDGATTLKNNLIVSGNVGIGTNKPNARLDVNGTVSAAKVYSRNVTEEKTDEKEVSTSSKNWVDMPGMKVTVTTGERPLFILFVVSEAWVSKDKYAYYQLMLDGNSIGHTRHHWVSRHSSVVILRMPKVKEGQHIIKAQWKVGAGTARSFSTRTLTVIEL
jgi:hypothetical protein